MLFNVNLERRVLNRVHSDHSTHEPIFLHSLGERVHGMSKCIKIHRFCSLQFLPQFVLKSLVPSVAVGLSCGQLTLMET